MMPPAQATIGECLRALSTGSWRVGEDVSWVPDAESSSCTLRDFDSRSAMDCFTGKWIFLLGDSSLRMLFHYWVTELATELNASIAAGKICPEHDVWSEPLSHCWQDVNHGGARLTYQSITGAAQLGEAWDVRAYSSASKPAVLIYETGPWDHKRRDERSLDDSILSAAIRRTLDMEAWFHGSKIWAGMPACLPTPQDSTSASRGHADNLLWVRRFNKAVQTSPIMQHYAYWDRQALTDVKRWEDVACTNGSAMGEMNECRKHWAASAMGSVLYAACSAGTYHPTGMMLRHLSNLVLSALCPVASPVRPS